MPLNPLRICLAVPGGHINPHVVRVHNSPLRRMEKIWYCFSRIHPQVNLSLFHDEVRTGPVESPLFRAFSCLFSAPLLLSDRQPTAGRDRGSHRTRRPFCSVATCVGNDQRPCRPPLATTSLNPSATSCATMFLRMNSCGDMSRSWRGRTTTVYCSIKDLLFGEATIRCLSNRFC